MILSQETYIPFRFRTPANLASNASTRQSDWRQFAKGGTIVSFLQFYESRLIFSVHHDQIRAILLFHPAYYLASTPHRAVPLPPTTSPPFLPQVTTEPAPPIHEKPPTASTPTPPVQGTSTAFSNEDTHRAPASCPTGHRPPTPANHMRRGGERRQIEGCGQSASRTAPASADSRGVSGGLTAMMSEGGHW